MARAACLLLVLLALASQAAAAPARVGLDFPLAPPLAPGQERALQGNLTYGYDAPSANATNVTIVPVAAPPWLTAGVEPAALALDASRPDGRTRVPVNLTLGVRPGTEALLQHTLELRVQAGGNPSLEDVNNTAGVVVRVAYLGDLAVRAVDASVRTPPGVPADFTLEVTNRGNGPARVTFLQGDHGRVLMVPPPGLIVERNQTRAVNLTALGNETGAYPLTLRYASAHAFDPVQLGPGGEVQVTLHVQSEGVPGPSAVLPALAAALAVALLRRYRR